MQVFDTVTDGVGQGVLAVDLYGRKMIITDSSRVHRTGANPMFPLPKTPTVSYMDRPAQGRIDPNRIMDEVEVASVPVRCAAVFVCLPQLFRQPHRLRCSWRAFRPNISFALAVSNASQAYYFQLRAKAGRPEGLFALASIALGFGIEELHLLPVYRYGSGVRDCKNTCRQPLCAPGVGTII